MRGFTQFLRKELTETFRTWRIWVLPGLLLFFALTSPVIAKMTPQLLESVASGQEGLQITIPEPTYLDSYSQWVKNLQQLVAIALLLTTGGIIAGERSSGTAVLVLTKPVSRSAFVIAKYLSHALLVIVSTLVGAFACWGTTYAVFGEAPVSRIVEPTAAWLAFALVLIAVMTAFSAGMKSLAAGGAGIGAFFAISILSLWGPALRYSPAGLAGAPSSLLMGENPALVWPLLTGALAVIALVGAAVLIFRRIEL